MIEPLPQLLTRIQAAVPGAQVQPGPSDSFYVDVAHAVAVARFLRDDPQLRFDYASNVTGVDWLDLVTKEKVKVKKVVDGVEKDVDETVKNYTRVIEDFVRKYPEQYFWQHRRWRRQPPDTPEHLREP